MSTKTLRKRIALVAVAALGFGLMSAAPSSAANTGIGTLSGIALASSATPTAGATVTVTATYTTAARAASGNADTIAIVGILSAVPSGGATAVTAASGTVVTCTTAVCTLGNALNTHTVTQAATSVLVDGNTGTATFAFTPPSAVPGSYTMTVFHDAGTLNGTFEAGETFQTIAITVGSVGGAAANQLPNSASTTASVTGATFDGHRVSSVGIDTVQVSGRTGIQVGFAPQYRVTRNGAAAAIAESTGADLATKYATIAYSVANPAGTAVTVYSSQGGTTASASQNIAGIGTIELGADNTAANTTAVTQSISPTTGWPQKGTAVYFAAATAGTYTITAFHDQDGDSLVDVGEATTTSTVVIVADALPSITMTVYGSSVPADAAAGNAKGHLVKISLKNGTSPASLGLSEVLTITGPTGTVIDDKSVRNANFKLEMTADAGDTTSTTLTQTAFDAAGNAYITVGNSTAAGGATYALTATITGGTGAGATGSGSFTVLDPALYVPTTFPDAALTWQNLTGVDGTGRAANETTSTSALTVKDSTATTVSIGGTPGATTAKAYRANLTDNFGLITGVIGGTYTLYSTIGTTTTTATSVKSFSVPVPAMSSATSANAVTLTILVYDTSATADVVATFNISRATAVATKSYSNVSLDANSLSIRAGVASSNKMTVKVIDQFGNALPNISVNAAIAGRNATTVIATMLSDASGLVSYLSLIHI